MDTSNSLLDSIEIETHVDYDRFTLAECDWLPEARDGMALTALQNDIEANGLLHPIVADEKNCIWCGRLRFLACQNLGREFLVRRIKSQDGEAAARRDLKHRMLTLLDKIRFVGSVIDKLDAELGKECPRATIAEHMKIQYGWQYGSSDKQMKHLRDLHKILRGLSAEKLEILRVAKTVNAARKALGLTSESDVPRGSAFTVGKLRDELTRILELAPPGEEKEKGAQVVKELRKLLARIPKRKAKSNAMEPQKAKSKKTKAKSKKTKAKPQTV